MTWNVVFHIDEVMKWPLVLGNIKNFIHEMGDRPYQIDVVVNAEAVLCVWEKEWQIDKEVQTLSEQSVRFDFCKKALKGNHIPASALPRAVQMVPSGILRVVELQMDGYAYVKP